MQAEVNEPLKVGDEFTASLRANLAVQNMLAAARFSRRVAELEENNKSQEFGPFWEEILHNSIASITCCASSLEAYANELFFDRGTIFPKYSTSLLDNLWETYERKSILEKFEFALLLLSEKPSIDKGSILYQNVRIVIDLRNALIHFKPEWDTEADLHRKLSNQLKYKFAPSPFLNDELIFPKRWATHGCTRWGVQSCLKFAAEFERLSSLPPKYPQSIVP
jgi:hypothetical protein